DGLALVEHRRVADVPELETGTRAAAPAIPFPFSRRRQPVLAHERHHPVSDEGLHVRVHLRVRAEDVEAAWDFLGEHTRGRAAGVPEPEERQAAEDIEWTVGNVQLPRERLYDSLADLDVADSSFDEPLHEVTSTDGF